MSGLRRRILDATLTVSVCAALGACSSPTPAPGAPTAGTIAPPAATATAASIAPVSVAPATATAARTVPPPTVIEMTPGPVDTPPPADTPAPANATTFHLVIADGSKAGTWDASDVGPTACSYVADLDRWNVSHLGPPPLTFIDAGLDSDLPVLLVAFDGESPNAVRMRSLGDVTYTVDDRGETATIEIVSEENEADFDDRSPSEDVGQIELTVECAAPFRYP
jgi:hypothetical protein